MKIFKHGKSISGKVFVFSAIIAVVIGVTVTAWFVTQSRMVIGKAIDDRDGFWLDRLPDLLAAAGQVRTDNDLQALFADLQTGFPELAQLEIVDASGNVIVDSSQPAEIRTEQAEGGERQSIDAAGRKNARVITIHLAGGTGTGIRITFTDAMQASVMRGLELKAILVGIVSLAVGFALFYVIILFSIKKPLHKLLTASQALASNAGDLTGKIDIDSKDELGRFGTTLNDIFYNLSGIINMIRTTADKVNFSAQGLSASTEQMNSITEETSMTVQNIAKSTDLQAHKVEDMIKEIRNMERSVKQVANSAELAASAATNASETATKGGDSAKEAVEKINEIYKVINESAEIIRHLGERSNQIGEIVDVITDIADQTNLLALNAAIEAARAGEAGSGFAVVADEVRKLAEGSAKAADEIATLIRQTQQDTQIAVRSIELGAKEVTEGKDVITRTGESLDEIVEVLKSSSDMARRISAATNELSRGMKNVISSIDEISGSAEKNASATQETAASMEQMTSSMEDVASSAQKLSDMAIQLRENVGRFKISEGGQDEQNVIAWSDVLKGE